MSSNVLRRNSGSLRQEVAQSHQVVDRTGEGEHPIHFEQAAMSHLAQQGDGLQPAKTFLDSFPFALAEAVAWLPRSPAVDGTATTPTVVLCNMRGHLHVAALSHKIRRIEAFVPT